MEGINDFNELSKLCIICLSNTRNLIDTSDFLFDDQKYVLIRFIIQKVLSVTVKSYFPKVICVECLGSLKIAFKLKKTFEKSIEALKKWLHEHELSALLDEVPELPIKEIQKGSQKSDILKIDENDKEDGDNSKCLNNLGTNISEMFAKEKSPDKPPNELIKAKASHIPDINQYILEDGQPILDSDCNSTETDGNAEIEATAVSQLIVNKNKKTTKKEANFTCQYCLKIYRSQARFKTHMKICSRYKSIYSCSLCTKSFQTLKSLNCHTRSTHENALYPCSECKEVFTTRSKLRYHRLSKHSDKEHVCEICGKVLVSPRSLGPHKLLHSQKNTAQCVCPICGKSFHYSSGLFYHLKIHNKERNYLCQFCDRTFYTHSARKRHELTHTGERPYPCKICCKRFLTTTELKKHGFIHSGYKPVSCSYCNKGFRSRFNYQMHLLSHTGAFKCEGCEKGFVTSAVLKFHYKMKHKHYESLENK